MFHDVKNIFHILTIFQCLFFAGLLLVLRKKGRPTSNFLLAGFLIARAAAELGGVFFHFQSLRPIIYQNAPHLFWIDLPFDFLYVPVLYLYILSLTRKDFRLKTKHLAHLSLSLAALAYVVVRFGFRSAEAVRAFLSPEARFTNLEGDIISAVGWLQLFAYAAAGLAALRRYRAEIREVFSTLDQINLAWLTSVLYGFIAWQALSIFEYGLWLIIGARTIIYLLYIASEVTFLAFLCVLFVRGLGQPAVFTGEIAGSLRRKYEKTLIPESAKEAYRAKLAAIMETEKPYLDPLLSLPDLAKRTGIPPHHLSQVINADFGQNFFDFVNSYRIKESQRLLAESAAAERTILDIIYETGFNSKSVFNTVFKKSTGMTPSEYKRQINAS